MAAVKRAPEATRQGVLAELPAASELESWLRLRKQAGGAFVWDIDGFIGQEGKLASLWFSVGGYRWQLACNSIAAPDAGGEERRVGLYLRLAPEFHDPGGRRQAASHQ